MQEIKKFYLELSKDEEFKVKLKDFTKKNGSDYEKMIEKLILPQAQKMGYNFTKEDLLAYEEENNAKVLNGELADVSGGKNRAMVATATALAALSLGSMIGTAIPASAAKHHSHHKQQTSFRDPNGGSETGASFFGRDSASAVRRGESEIYQGANLRLSSASDISDADSDMSTVGSSVRDLDLSGSSTRLSDSDDLHVSQEGASTSIVSTEEGANEVTAADLAMSAVTRRTSSSVRGSKRNAVTLGSSQLRQSELEDDSNSGTLTSISSRGGSEASSSNSSDNESVKFTDSKVPEGDSFAAQIARSTIGKNALESLEKFEKERKDEKLNLNPFGRTLAARRAAMRGSTASASSWGSSSGKSDSSFWGENSTDKVSSAAKVVVDKEKEPSSAEKPSPAGTQAGLLQGVFNKFNKDLTEQQLKKLEENFEDRKSDLLRTLDEHKECFEEEDFESYKEKIENAKTLDELTKIDELITEIIF